jgi:hypothetical protein
MQVNGLSGGPNYSRRLFLGRVSQWSALFAAYPLIPLPGLAELQASDRRIAQTPLVDKGFAAVRKVGDGLYATISDTSKGLETMCNGGQRRCAVSRRICQPCRSRISARNLALG